MPRRSPFQQRDARLLPLPLSGAGTHGNPYVSLCERGRIVPPAITGHPRPLIPLAGAPSRPLPSFEATHRHRTLCRACPLLPWRWSLLVSRDHNDLQPRLTEFADCIRRGFLDRIGDPNQARRLAVHGDQHYRLALFAQCFSRVRATVQDRPQDRGTTPRFPTATCLAETVPFTPLPSGGA